MFMVGVFVKIILLQSVFLLVFCEMQCSNKYYLSEREKIEREEKQRYRLERFVENEYALSGNMHLYPNIKIFNNEVLRLINKSGFKGDRQIAECVLMSYLHEKQENQQDKIKDFDAESIGIWRYVLSKESFDQNVRDGFLSDEEKPKIYFNSILKQAVEELED